MTTASNLDLELAFESLKLLLDPAQPIDDLVNIHLDHGAAIAGNAFRVVIEPSDRLHMLIAALGTGDFERFILEHGFAPYLGLDNPMVAARGSAQQ